MYQVMYRVENHEFVIDFVDRDNANRFVQVLKNSDITPYVKRKQPVEDDEYMTVSVAFTRGGRIYTYLTTRIINVGSFVVVNTNDGPQVVKVINSCWKTRAELEKVCPFANYKYIVGEVK